ncbi:Uncharacterized protein PECH_006877 [Penicillium ucsense]|uniref:Uncharacterized protein n=1 Tax=Penicillium ucsense TaxID=2839758 RepID=A0A8J8W7Z8_9EURO|nr:Uncharacterized protein PECM_004559 [Penicillium ucsense]KAF7738924.1 Uncharacterized protein PECH_006877 [Penicillium ucsense]
MVFGACCLKALSPRTAIHEDDLDRYDAFLSNLHDSHFLDMYLENGQVKIDVYAHPSNELTLSEHFTPSDVAHQYFAQETERAKEALQSTSAQDQSAQESADTSGVEKRAICPRGDTVLEQEASVLDKRVSRCYRFCGTIRNCRGNNGCPHCYAVRQGCLWQKWCR